MMSKGFISRLKRPIKKLVHFKNELPIIAAAYRLTGGEALRKRVLAQLSEMATWSPLQRPGWTLYAPGHRRGFNKVSAIHTGAMRSEPEAGSGGIGVHPCLSNSISHLDCPSTNSRATRPASLSVSP